MDMTVTQIGAVVVAELRAAGYLESTIGGYERTIRALAQHAAPRSGIYSPGLGAEFASMTITPRTGRFSAQRRRNHCRLVAVFDSYVRTGRVVLSVRGRGGGGPWPAQAGLAALVAAWEADMADRGLAPETRSAYGRVARGYLVFLEQRGITSLDAADGASVLAFLESLLDRWASSSLFWAVSRLRRFLAFAGRADLVAAVNLALVRRSHPVFAVLSDGDQQLVVTACAAGAVSARDAAITLLALTTGLRACDILLLRLADIDWRGQTISIVQQKTGNPLTLPLPSLVAGMLAGYVLNERPGTADDHVFVRSAPPHVPLVHHGSVHAAITQTFRRAGVTGVKAGTRFLRHNAASRLLRAATPLPTISAVLGHASQESTSTYIRHPRHDASSHQRSHPRGKRTRRTAVAVDRVGSERRARQALADQADQTELERARLAVLEQRTRFARELHDVIAHHMSLMAIRAESAPHRLGELPEPVRAEFGSLSESAREALADMRRLLSVLRSDQPAAHAPQPGLEDLPRLIGAARQAGMTVELSAPAALDQVPPSAGLCAYRVVQEAVSNAGRHAAGAPVAVSVGHDADTVTLEVTNGPGVPAGQRVHGRRPGHGLTGMRERVELLGGSLSAGPAPGGGFVVSAVLPLGGSA